MRFIKLLRQLLGIGQKDLARRAKLSTRELARIEAGEAVPERGHIQDLDAAFSEIVKERVRDA